VIAGIADRVMVMYGADRASTGPVDRVFADPAILTRGRCDHLPKLHGARAERLTVIEGQPRSWALPRRLHLPRHRSPHVLTCATG
jgi:peptide/nickel transport system ATP-binding protein/oligopeptide transport system ATP-binding protein